MPPKGQAASSIVSYHEHLGKKNWFMALWTLPSFCHVLKSKKGQHFLHGTPLGRKVLQVSDLNRILVRVVNQLNNICLKSTRTTAWEVLPIQVLLIHIFWAEKKGNPPESALFFPYQMAPIRGKDTSRDPGRVGEDEQGGYKTQVTQGVWGGQCLQIWALASCSNHLELLELWWQGLNEVSAEL